MQIHPETQIQESCIENARRFTALFDRTLLGIYVIDLNGVIIEINRTAAQQLGYSVEELVGKSFDEILADEQTHKRALDRITRLIGENALGEPMELRMRRKGGGNTWLEIESSLLVEDGRPYGIIGIAFDITERKMAEKRERHLLDVSTAVHNINQLIVRERNKHTLILNACDFLHKVPEYTSAWIVLIDAEGKVTDSGSAGKLNDVTGILADLGKSPLPPCVAQAIKQPNVVLIDSHSKDTYCGDCFSACIAPGEIKMIVRVSAGPQIQGIMGVSATGGFMLHEQEKALIDEAASDIGFGLYRIALEDAEHNARMEQQRQREFLNLALQSSGMGEWELNVRTGELRWGKMLEKIYGLRPGEFEGIIDGFKKRVHRHWRKELLENVDAAFESGEPGTEYEAEYPIVHGSGETRWLQSRGRLIAGTDGSPEKIIGLSWDITDRKHAEEALKISEERYHTFMQETVEGTYLIVFTEPIPISLPVEKQVKLFYERTRIVEANDAFAQMYGYTKVSDFGEMGLEIFHGGRSDSTNIEFLSNFVKNKYRLANAVSHEVDHEGNKRVFLNNLFGIICNDGLVRVWGTQQDITELTKAEEILRKQKSDLTKANADLSSANRRLRELDQLKSDFVSMASHELRTPITSILGFAQTLLAPDIKMREDERITYLTIIQKEARRLGNLINDLLDLSRIEVGRGKEDIEETSLHELANEVIESLGIPEGITVRVCSDTLGKSPFPCSSGTIRRVFLNLIENAIRFADKIDIEITGSSDERMVSVCDNGPGIAPEYREKIFEKFYRVQSEKQPGKGSGLGLAMVKDIVEMHGGTIWVESQPDKGAEFRFTLKARE